MTRKLITFLGAGNYTPCRYSYEGRVSGELKFVQIAMAQFFRPDKVLVFTTPQAFSINYEPKGALLDQVQEAELSHVFQNVEIPEGRSESEVWSIFEKVLGEVTEGDEIIFDITHSFRSIPVIALACLQYVRALKGVLLKGVFYGAFEAKDQNGIAPVFDLTPFVQLMDWSQAVAEFTKYGQAGMLGELLEAEVLPRKKASKGADREAQTLSLVNAMLKSCIDCLSTCRGKDIYHGSLPEEINARIEELKKLPGTIPAFYPLLERIEQKVNKLKGSVSGVSPEVAKGFGAVEWCLEHSLIQQAYTLLQENIVTHMCQRVGLDYSILKQRDLVSMALAIAFKKREEWNETARTHIEIVERVHSEAGKELLELYGKLTQCRNDIHHGGITCATNPRNISETIQRVYPQIVQLFNRESVCPG